MRYPRQADIQIRSLEEYFATRYRFRKYQHITGSKVLGVDKISQKWVLWNLERSEANTRGEIFSASFYKRDEHFNIHKIERTKYQSFKLRTLSCTIASLDCSYHFHFAADQWKLCPRAAVANYCPRVCHSLRQKWPHFGSRSSYRLPASPDLLVSPSLKAHLGVLDQSSTGLKQSNTRSYNMTSVPPHPEIQHQLPPTRTVTFPSQRTDYIANCRVVISVHQGELICAWLSPPPTHL